MKLTAPFVSAVIALSAQLVDAAVVNATLTIAEKIQSRALCTTPSNDSSNTNFIANLRRLYNPTITDHFLTTDGLAEAQYTSQGYISDGDPTTTPYLATSGLVFFNNVPGTVALFRLYNSATSTHLFTADTSVLSTALASGYAYEGLPYRQIVGHVYLAGGCPGTVPLYWAHSDALTDNYYTVFPAKYNAYIANGWTGKGIMAWIYPPV